MSNKHLILIIMLFFSFSSFAESEDTLKFVTDTIMLYPDEIGQDVKTAIQNGDAKTLAKYFNSTIIITTPDKKGTYSKSQAEFIIKKFFSTYPPISFTINSEGNTGSNSSYYIGTYVSKSKSFRSYYMIKKVNNKEVIHIIKFE